MAALMSDTDLFDVMRGMVMDIGGYVCVCVWSVVSMFSSETTCRVTGVSFSQRARAVQCSAVQVEVTGTTTATYFESAVLEIRQARAAGK